MASFPVQHYLSFVFMVLGFLALLGPGTFTILLAAKWAGVQGGYSALLGIMVSDLVLMVIAVLGLSALLMSQPKMLIALQTLGILYLLWIGLSLLLKALKSHQPLSSFKIMHKPVFYLKQGIYTLRT